MIFFLLFAVFAQAGDIFVGWGALTPGNAPRAVFYNAATDSLFVSMDSAKGPLVEQWGMEGQKISDVFSLHEKKTAGALRAYDGKIYWAVGNTVWRFTPEGKEAKAVAEVPGSITDIAIAGNGALYIGTAEGVIYKNSKDEKFNTGSKVTGLFFLENTLFALREKTLDKIQGDSVVSEKICSSPCRGLERSSAGEWIMTEGKALRIKKRVADTFKHEPGRFAYVYRRDPKDDLLVVPFPDFGGLQAYKFYPKK